MMKNVKRFTAFLLSLVLVLLMVAGCGQSKQSKKVVFKAGGQEVTLDEVWFYCQSVQEYYESYYSSMFSSPDVWTSEYPVDNSEGTTEQSTLENVAKRSAIKQIRQTKVAVSHAKDYDVALTTKEQEQVISQAKSFMSQVTKDEKVKMGLTQDLAEKVFRESAIVNKMKTALAKKKGIEISDEEAQTSKIYYIQFPTMMTNSEGKVAVSTDEQQKQAYDDAQDALERVQAGNDIATVAAAYGLSGSSGELNIDADTNLPDEISDSIKELKDGEVFDKVISANDGYYIVKMLEVVDEDATADKKQQLLSEKEQELLDKKFEKWTKDDDFDYDKDVNWKYMKEINFIANSSVKASTTTASSTETADATTEATTETATTEK